TNGEIKRSKAPTATEIEALVQCRLSRERDNDGNELEFGEEWKIEKIDGWLRRLFPELFEYLDTCYGSDECHWVLVKKERQQVFVIKRQTYTGTDLVAAKG
ncbi:hypothetical protein B0H16DRAFT_1234985, partial [Mycena metata]